MKILQSFEIAESIKKLPNNKSPGTDGISIEFYKLFWHEIKHFLMDSFNYSFRHNILSIDLRRAILTLIPKSGKDIRLLKHWRPISLLNSDYKILAKALALRIQKVIGKLVHQDQAGYIQNHYIGDNIRTTLDILDITKQQVDPGLLVLVDFEKAF